MKLEGISQHLEKERILDRILEDDRSIEKTLIRRGYTFKSNKTGLSKKLLLNINIFEEGRRDTNFII